jgi:hypothetical protein
MESCVVINSDFVVQNSMIQNQSNKVLVFEYLGICVPITISQTNKVIILWSKIKLRSSFCVIRIYEGSLFISYICNPYLSSDKK